jgi:hypothetical protein
MALVYNSRSVPPSANVEANRILPMNIPVPPAEHFEVQITALTRRARRVGRAVRACAAAAVAGLEGPKR